MLLKTDRLTIRHIVEDDWKSIKAIWVDFRADALSQYDKPHNTDDEDVRERIAKWAANSGREHLFFAVCLGDTVIGYATFHIREDSYELGYCFHSAYHGKGYAKESLTALFDYLATLGITNTYRRHSHPEYTICILIKVIGFSADWDRRCIVLSKMLREMTSFLKAGFLN